MEKLMVDLIIENISQLVTVKGGGTPKTRDLMGELEIVPGGAVAAVEGVIRWVGKSSELSDSVTLKPGGRVIDAGGNCVLPGFVDPHTHLVFAGTREDEFAEKIAGVPYLEIAAKGGGIKRTVRTTRNASEEQLFEIGHGRVREALAFGVTSLEIKSGYGLDEDTETKMLRVAGRLNDAFPLEIVRTFLGAHEIPPGSSREAYLDEVCRQMIPRVAEEGLAEYCDVFCEKGVFSVEEARRVLQTGIQHGLKPKIHAEQLTNSGGAQLAAELPAVSADHLDHIDEKSMEAMADAGVSGVILPGAVFFLGLKRYPPVREMIHSGMPVALATDFNPGSCMSQNLPLMMTIACTQCRMTLEEAITACTLNAAHAIGRADVCGSIEVGKRADFVILDYPDYRILAYHFGHNHIRHVVCRGTLVVENGAVIV